MKKLILLNILAALLLVGCGGQLMAEDRVVEEEPVMVVDGEMGEENVISAPSSEPSMTSSMAAPQINSMMAESGMQPAAASRPLSRQIAQVSGSKEEQVIALAAAHPPIAEVLATYPGWVGYASADDESEVTWYVEFHSAEDEWLGDCHVNLETGEVYDVYMPRDLTDEEFAAGREKIEAYMQNSPEAAALLGDFSLWDHDIWYDKWDDNWHAWYNYGLDTWEFVFYLDGDSGSVWLDDYYDPNVLKGDEEAAWNRQQAVELAYQAPGIDEALAGYDNWYTYASDQGDGLWTVEFAADDQLLFSVLVDIVNWQVIEGGR